MSQNRILLVEDDIDLVDSLKQNLGTRGFVLESAADGKSGLAMALSHSYSAIILDVNLGGMDGIEVCRRIREKNRHIPILMLTCQGEEIDKVVGLEVGADDHVTKPFRISELVARLRALIRRSELVNEEKDGGASGPILRVDELIIDIESRRVTVSDEAIDLTPLEFTFLVFLASHPRRTFTREQILEGVWQTNNLGHEHVVTNTAKRLRAKLNKGSQPPKFVQTVRGVGYRISPPDKV